MVLDQRYVWIGLTSQRLELREGDEVLLSAEVSTALNGAGEQMGTGCTPRGRHVVRARIGEGCAAGSVFVGRRPTGEIWSPALARQHPGRDWILTRILWLSGCEPGRNRFGSVDSMRRYIYIHGTPDDQPMGVPRSHGCIRMRNDELLRLFEHVSVGMVVFVDPEEG